jgi:hypothetical protein
MQSRRFHHDPGDRRFNGLHGQINAPCSLTKKTKNCILTTMKESLPVWKLLGEVSAGMAVAL